MPGHDLRIQEGLQSSLAASQMADAKLPTFRTDKTIMPFREMEFGKGALLLGVQYFVYAFYSHFGEVPRLLVGIAALVGDGALYF